ncbi:MAG: hypothetical protein J6I45_07035 [Clostridia bacterium]|nr:hypothetical protein [Clostridia bacterium]
MTINTITKSGRLIHNGVKLAAYVISYPAFDEPTGIGDFCRRYAEAFEGAIQGSIAARLTEEYEASSDPKKRFRSRSCQIELGYRITEENNGMLSMVWCAQALRKGETLFSHRSAQTWSSTDEFLLTAREFGVGGRRGSTCNFFLEGENIVILDGSEELRMPIRHQSQAFLRRRQ